MNLYLWYKALHLISVIAWMAAMLYLPRIFVYHAETKEPQCKDVFKLMEKRLLRYIMTPAMIFSYFFAILLILQDPSYYLKSGWFHTKLLAVFLLSACHGYFAICVKKFAIAQNKNSAKFYRIINEVPTILMIVIIIMVIIKPF
jgi:putative membrane protein